MRIPAEKQAELRADSTADFKHARTTRQVDVLVEVGFQKFGLPYQAILFGLGECVDVFNFCRLHAQILIDFSGGEPIDQWKGMKTHSQLSPSQPRRCAVDVEPWRSIRIGQHPARLVTRLATVRFALLTGGGRASLPHCRQQVRQIRRLREEPAPRPTEVRPFRHVQQPASEVSRRDGYILGVEEELKSSVIEGVPDLLCRLDLLVDAGDECVLTDFKTSRSRWSEADAQAASGQLLLYHELVSQIADKPLRLQFVVPTKTKLPQLELHNVAVDATRTSRLRALIRRVWGAIQAGNFYPVPSAQNCLSCAFRSQCAKWSDG